MTGITGFFGALLFTMVVVFITAVLEGESAVSIARLGGGISVVCLGTGFVGLAGCAVIERRRGASIRWAVAAFVVLAGSTWALTMVAA